MAIADTITSMKENLKNAYDKVVEKGGNIGRLPKEYQQVEYIESSGTQYIDTLISPTNNFIFEQEKKFVRIGTGNVYQMSGRYESSSRAFQLGIDGNGYIRANIYGVQYISSNAVTVGTKYIYKGIANNGIFNLYINNNLITSDTYTYNNIDTTLYLFNRNSSIANYKRGTAEYIQLFSCKMYDNDTIIRDYIPCYRKSDNEVGLYDLVNNEFYTNQGTGTFLKGNDVTQPKNLANLSTAIDSIECIQQFEYNYDGPIGSRIKKINYFHVPENVTNFNFFQNMSSLEEVNNFTYITKPTAFALFQSCTNFKKIPKIDLKNVTQMVSSFNGCTKISDFSILESLGNDCTNMFMAFANCTSMFNLPEFYGGKLQSIQNTFQNATNLENFNGIVDLGKAYIQKSNNYVYYTLNLSSCTKLTHESLVNIINNLYDLNLTYKVASGGTLYTQSLVLGATNLAKLSDDEKAIATTKGWVLS